MNKELAKTLTTALVQFIDRERQEGTMDCSSYECEKIEKAFEGGMYDVVEEFLNTKLTRLTAFEKTLAEFVNDVLAKEPQNPFIWIKGSGWADKLFALAKKELLSYTDKLPLWMKDALDDNYQKGYWKGRQEALEEYNKSVAYRFPSMPVNPYGWGCDGTHCTNPHGDCINCPKRYSSGETITTPNTSSGASTLKAEG